jgi:hypothetical protein
MVNNPEMLKKISQMTRKVEISRSASTLCAGGQREALATPKLQGWYPYFE